MKKIIIIACIMFTYLLHNNCVVLAALSQSDIEEMLDNVSNKESIKIIGDHYGRDKVRIIVELESEKKDMKRDIKKELNELGIVIKYHHIFKSTLKGFSATTLRCEVEKIKGIEGIKSILYVNEYNEKISSTNVQGKSVGVKKTYDDAIIANIEEAISKGHHIIQINIGEQIGNRNHQFLINKVVEKAKDAGVLCIVNEGSYETSWSKAPTVLAIKDSHGGEIAELCYERVMREWKTTIPSQRVEEVKSLIKASIKNVPNKQDSEIIDLKKALDLNVLLQEVGSGESEILTAAKESKLTFSVKVINKSNRLMEGFIKGELETPYYFLKSESRREYEHLSHLSSPLLIMDHNILGKLPIYLNNKILGSEGQRITVQANESLVLHIVVDLDRALVFNKDSLLKLKEAFPHGVTVKGNLTFVELEKGHEQQNAQNSKMTFSSFYGSWSKSPILASWEDVDHDKIIHCSGIYDESGNLIEPNEIGDVVVGGLYSNGKVRSISFVPVLLTDVAYMRVNLLSSEKHKMRQIGYVEGLKKSERQKNLYQPNFKWRLSHRGRVIDDGRYYLQVETGVNGDKESKQVYEYPFVIQHKGAKIKKINIMHDENPYMAILSTSNKRAIKAYGLGIESAQGDTKLIMNYTGEFKIEEIEKELFSGGNDIVPFIQSQNRVVHVGPRIDEDALLGNKTLGVIAEVKFKENIKLGLAENQDMTNINPIIIRENRVKESVDITYGLKGEAERVIYYEVDSNLLTFKSNTAVQGKKTGHSVLKALYINNDTLLSAMPKITTSGAFRYMRDSYKYAKNYKKGIDYQELRSLVTVETSIDDNEVSHSRRIEPDINITNIKYNSLLNGRESCFSKGKLKIEGTIKSTNKIMNFNINGQNRMKSLYSLGDNKTSRFFIEVDVKDQQMNFYHFEVFDKDGMNTEYIFKCFVDQQYPFYELMDAKIITIRNKPYYQFRLIATDILPDYKIYVNGEEIVKPKITGKPNTVDRGFTKNMIEEVIKIPLKVGKNKITIKGRDKAQNQKTKVFSVEYKSGSITELKELTTDNMLFDLSILKDMVKKVKRNK